MAIGEIPLIIQVQRIDFVTSIFANRFQSLGRRGSKPRVGSIH